MSFSMFAIILVIVGLLLVFKAVTVVPQGWNYTVERFGKYTSSLPAGLHLITPFIEFFIE